MRYTLEAVTIPTYNPVVYCRDCGGWAHLEHVGLSSEFWRCDSCGRVWRRVAVSEVEDDE